MKATIEERAFEDGTVYEVVVTVGETSWSFDSTEPVTDDDIAAFKAAKKWFDKREES